VQASYLSHSSITNCKRPSKEPPRATASSLEGPYYFIYTFQLEGTITDVDIKAKLALRGTASAKKLKDWHRSQAAT
jgi:hypothetical protein